MSLRMGGRDVGVQHEGEGGDCRDSEEGISSSNNVGCGCRGAFLLVVFLGGGEALVLTKNEGSSSMSRSGTV